MEQKLTITEKLILSNQYKILAFLDADNQKQYNELAENITDGYGFLYSDIFTRISQELQKEDTDHVLDTLMLYADLKFSFDQLSDKEGIDQSDIEFHGFCGNTETSLLRFSRALVNSDRFESIRENAIKNSHYPTRTKYSEQVKKSKEVSQTKMLPWSKEVIIEIINCRG